MLVLLFLSLFVGASAITCPTSDELDFDDVKVTIPTEHLEDSTVCYFRLLTSFKDVGPITYQYAATQDEGGTCPFATNANGYLFENACYTRFTDSVGAKMSEVEDIECCCTSDHCTNIFYNIYNSYEDDDLIVEGFHTARDATTPDLDEATTLEQYNLDTLLFTGISREMYDIKTQSLTECTAGDPDLVSHNLSVTYTGGGAPWTECVTTFLATGAPTKTRSPTHTYAPTITAPTSSPMAAPVPVKDNTKTARHATVIALSVGIAIVVLVIIIVFAVHATHVKSSHR